MLLFPLAGDFALVRSAQTGSHRVHHYDTRADTHGEPDARDQLLAGGELARIHCAGAALSVHSDQYAVLCRDPAAQKQRDQRHVRAVTQPGRERGISIMTTLLARSPQRHLAFSAPTCRGERAVRAMRPGSAGAWQHMGLACPTQCTGRRTDLRYGSAAGKAAGLCRRDLDLRRRHHRSGADAIPDEPAEESRESHGRALTRRRETSGSSFGSSRNRTAARNSFNDLARP